MRVRYKLNLWYEEGRRSLPQAHDIRLYISIRELLVDELWIPALKLYYTKQLEKFREVQASILSSCGGSLSRDIRLYKVFQL